MQYCYNYSMNRIVNFLQRYLAIIAALIGISILLSVTFSSFIVTSNNHKAAEMYIGELKYSIEIDSESINTLTVPTGETIIDVKVNNLNPVDTYYKLLYLKNTNITVKYYESAKDTDDVVTTYNKPNDSVASSNSNTIKLLITNNSESSQNIALTMKGGYITNTLSDIIAPFSYSEITLVETPSTNTYFCKTNDTLTQGLQYINGQYTYAYKLQSDYINGTDWRKIYIFDSSGIPNEGDGWGTVLTDRNSSNVVTSKLCTYINNKPIISMSNMFSLSKATAINLSSFNTKNVINMNAMFAGSKATTLDVSNFNTSNVTDMSYMFTSSQTSTVDVSNFDTSKVTRMNEMFSGSNAVTLDVSNFDTTNVFDMYNMFSGSVATALDVSNFDTSNVVNMGRMFAGSEATFLDVSNFDTSKVKNMATMFYATKSTILDVSNFDTSNVTDMRSMFCQSKAAVIDVSKFNTSNVTNMATMFCDNEITTLDVSGFDTSKVEDMSNMFSNSKITTLNLGNFDTSNVTNMKYMFYNSSNLKTIYVSSKFNIDNVTSSDSMFKNCTSLVGGSGTTYNSTYTDKTYAHIDAGRNNPGYFVDISIIDSDVALPNSFATDSWSTIAKAVRNNNISKYNVGDTRTVDIGTYGTHTLRIANKSTPDECKKEGFSQSACGFVIEFADIIVEHKMNETNTNSGGWPASKLYTFVNTDIYNALPNDLRSVIIDTKTISGYGRDGYEDDCNFISIDKLYLLSTSEVFEEGGNYDSAVEDTRQLDYYKNLSSSANDYSFTIKNYNSKSDNWWLRSPKFDDYSYFYSISSFGGSNYSIPVTLNGVSPAFRID